MSTARRASPSFRSTATVAESIFDFLIFFHKFLLYFRLYRSFGSRPPLLKVSLVIFCGNHFSTFLIKVCRKVDALPNSQFILLMSRDYLKWISSKCFITMKLDSYKYQISKTEIFCIKVFFSKTNLNFWISIDKDR